MLSTLEQVRNQLEEIYVEIAGRKFSRDNPLLIERINFTSTPIPAQKDPYQWEMKKGKTLFMKKEFYFDEDLRRALLYRWATLHYLNPRDRIHVIQAEIANAIGYNTIQNNKKKKLFLKAWEKQYPNYQIPFKTHSFYAPKLLPIVLKEPWKTKLTRCKGLLANLPNDLIGYSLYEIYLSLWEPAFEDLTHAEWYYLSQIITLQTDNHRVLSEKLNKSISTINTPVKSLKERLYYRKLLKINYARIGLDKHIIVFMGLNANTRKFLATTHSFVTVYNLTRNLTELGLIFFLAPTTDDANQKIQAYLETIQKNKELVLLLHFIEDQTTFSEYHNPNIFHSKTKTWISPVSMKEVQAVELPRFTEFKPIMNDIETRHLEYINYFRTNFDPQKQEIKKRFKWADKTIKNIENEIETLQLIKTVYYLYPVRNHPIIFGWIPHATREEQQFINDLCKRSYYGRHVLDQKHKIMFFLITVPLIHLQSTIQFMNIKSQNIRMYPLFTNLTHSSGLPLEYWRKGHWEFPSFLEYLKSDT